MKKIFILILLCGCAETKKPLVDKSEEDSLSSLIHEAIAPKMWQYGSSVDKMSNDTTYEAYIYSKDERYNSRLTIIKDSKSTEIMLSIEGTIFTEECGRIKFDEEKPLDFRASKSRDGGTIFFKNTKDVLQKLKTSKKLIIEPILYKGVPQLEFSIENLTWN